MTGENIANMSEDRLKSHARALEIAKQVAELERLNAEDLEKMIELETTRTERQIEINELSKKLS